MAPRKSPDQDARQRQKRRIHERSKIALFDVFREAFKERDAQKSTTIQLEDDSKNTVTQISGRSNARRLGVTEETLRRHVRAHLQTLMNTIRLDAAIDLTDAPLTAASVVNYGFQDLSNLTRKELTSGPIADSIKQSLADHEPRLVKSSIQVRIQTLEGDDYQRVAVTVAADLIADPADVPIEFVADVDTGAGKVILNAQRI